MLFLSSGTVDGSPRSTAVGLQNQGKTVYHISVVLKENQEDALSPELEMGLVPHTLVEKCQPAAEVMSVVPMEKSPRQGRTRLEFDRWPSQAGAGRGEERRDEEESEEVEGKMKTDRFWTQPSKKSGNYPPQERNVAEAAAAQRDSRAQRTQGSSLRAVTFHTKGLIHGEPGPGAGHSSLSRAVLRRPRHNETRLARNTLSMYGDAVKQGRDSAEDPETRLRRPRSVCMLAGPGPVQLESRNHCVFRRAGVLENEQQYRSRKAELRAVDGLSPAQRPSVPGEVTPRLHQRSCKPRPVSMTVLELMKKASDDEMDSQRSCSQTASDGGFLRGGFRWKFFSKVPQEKNRDKEWDRDVKSSSKVNKTDAPKGTFSSLRRSLSLRIRRTRPKEKVNLGFEAGSQEHFQTNSVSEEATMPPRPFSYLTGKMLPTPSEQTEDGGVQYIQYQSKGKIKVMEVPLCPTKLSSKPAQEEQSIWQLIANRFRRKEPPVIGKCETQLSQSKDTGQHPLTGNNKSQPVTIDTLAAAGSKKGQDSFVNSQEWTLSRSVPELKVGIVGNLSSGKSALVHRYLTGTYVQEESPEGGRFKKEIVVDGQSYLLLIRDEGGPPELQFAAWVDAVVFVFSLEDEISFQTVYNYFVRLSGYRNTAEVPMVLVGTQDAISAANPRVIDDSRARKLSNDLKRCTYYETCSTYGLNVERVFQDVAQKVVAMRKKQQLSIGPCKSLPNSPSHSSVPAASIPSVHINQAANGGGAFSDYSSSVPSTPSISQREMRIETIAASNTPTPIRKQSKRRSNIFTILSLQ
ncbi:arfGAP with GTPase domain, ankyrin repeat and PH domain 3 isoform X6 [Nelusetta ayraudi]|uniref:arfGAP with GTPase domain, ankyrin repeat and PH domain 3 isoform X6 n=1 Tax=Nelusetta ayraudi TaxID=303726 RepID=UPI003F6EED36